MLASAQYEGRMYQRGEVYSLTEDQAQSIGTVEELGDSPKSEATDGQEKAQEPASDKMVKKTKNK